MLTMNEICDRMLSRYDPDEVVELLEITTQDLLDAFEFRMVEMYDELNEEFEDE